MTGLTEDLRPCSQADLHSLVLFQPGTLGLQSLGDESRENAAVLQPMLLITPRSWGVILGPKL